MHFQDKFDPGMFQVFPGKNLGKTQTKNGLSLPRAASLRLTTVTATESPPSLASFHFFLGITVCFILELRVADISFTSTLASPCCRLGGSNDRLEEYKGGDKTGHLR